jgi:hypothetical protein
VIGAAQRRFGGAVYLAKIDVTFRRGALIAGPALPPLVSPDEQRGLTSGRFGWALAVSGSRLAIGDYAHDGEAHYGGAVYLYQLDPDTVTATFVGKLPAPGASPAYAYFGVSVCWALGGRVLAVGADGESGNAGAAYLYRMPETSGGKAIQVARISALYNSSATERLGFALAADGELLVVSAHTQVVNGDSDAGAAYVLNISSYLTFEPEEADANGSELAVLLYHLTAAGEAKQGGKFASSLGISGLTVAIGVLNERAVYLFYACAVGGNSSRPLPVSRLAKVEFGDMLPSQTTGTASMAVASGSLAIGVRPSPMAAPDDPANLAFLDLPWGASSSAQATVPPPPMPKDAIPRTVAALELTAAKNTSDPSASDAFGFAVAAAQGNSSSARPCTYVVGAYHEATFQGEISVYHQTGPGDMPVLIGKPSRERYGNVQTQSFGKALAADGALLVVGAENTNQYRGAAFLYRLDHTGQASPTYLGHLSTQGKLLAGGGFGFSVAIAGNVIVVGALLQAVSGPDVGILARAGRAYLFVLPPQLEPSSGEVRAKEHVFTSSNPTAGAKFASAVAIHASGKAAISSPEASAAKGMVEIFNVSTTTGEATFLFNLTADADAHQGALFGCTLAFGKSFLFVGACAAETNGVPIGAVYVFKRERGADGRYLRHARLVPTVTMGVRGFGASLYASDAWLVVGAPPSRRYDAKAGGVYIYDLAVFNETEIIVDTLAAGDEFGRSVAFCGNELVVGAWATDVHGQVKNRGSAYVVSLSSVHPELSTVEPTTLSSPVSPTTTTSFSLATATVSVNTTTTIALVERNPLAVHAVGRLRGPGEEDRFRTVTGAGLSVVALSGLEQSAYWFAAEKVVRLPLDLQLPVGAQTYFQSSASLSQPAAGRLLVGVPGNGSYFAGTVYLLEQISTTAPRLLGYFVPENATVSHFGRAVAVTAHVAVISATQDDQGDVFIYEAKAATPPSDGYDKILWTGLRLSQCDRFRNVTTLPGEYFVAYGRSESFGAALAAEESFIAIGDPGVNAVHLVHTADGLKLLDSARLPDEEAAGLAAARFGASVTMFVDAAGSLCLLVGAPGAYNGIGLIFAYKVEDWRLVHFQTLHAPDATDMAHFGAALAHDGASGRLLVGAPGCGPRQCGMAYTFLLNGSRYSCSGAAHALDSEARGFGSSVGLIAGVAVVGSETGHAYSFPPTYTAVNNTSGRVEVTTKVKSMSRVGAFAGGAASIASASGRPVLAVALPASSNGSSGNILLYDASTSQLLGNATCGKSVALVGPCATSGQSVAASGRYIAVASPDSEGGRGAITVYQLEKDAGDLTLMGVLRLPSSSQFLDSHQFGRRLDFVGDLLAVTVRSRAYEGMSSVLLFQATKGVDWIADATPVVTLGFNISGDTVRFGTSVSLSHDVVIVGMYRPDDGAIAAVYRVVRGMGGISAMFEEILTLPGLHTSEEGWGVQVAVSSQSYAAVSGPNWGPPGLGEESGRVAVFRLREPGSPQAATFLGYLAPATYARGWHYGASLAVSGSYIAIGAPDADMDAANGGTITIISITGLSLTFEALLSGKWTNARLGADLRLQGTSMTAVQLLKDGHIAVERYEFDIVNDVISTVVATASTAAANSTGPSAFQSTATLVPNATAALDSTALDVTVSSISALSRPTATQITSTPGQLSTLDTGEDKGGSSPTASASAGPVAAIAGAVGAIVLVILVVLVIVQRRRRGKKRRTKEGGGASTGGLFSNPAYRPRPASDQAIGTVPPLFNSVEAANAAGETALSMFQSVAAGDAYTYVASGGGDDYISPYARTNADANTDRPYKDIGGSVYAAPRQYEVPEMQRDPSSVAYTKLRGPHGVYESSNGTTLGGAAYARPQLISGGSAQDYTGLVGPHETYVSADGSESVAYASFGPEEDARAFGDEGVAETQFQKGGYGGRGSFFSDNTTTA